MMGSAWKSFWLQGFGSGRGFFFSQPMYHSRSYFMSGFFFLPCLGFTCGPARRPNSTVWLQFETTRHGSVRSLTRGGWVTARQLLPSSSSSSPPFFTASSLGYSVLLLMQLQPQWVWCEDDGVLWGQLWLELFFEFSFFISHFTLLTWSDSINEIYNTINK